MEQLVELSTAGFAGRLKKAFRGGTRRNLPDEWRATGHLTAPRKRQDDPSFRQGQRQTFAGYQPPSLRAFGTGVMKPSRSNCFDPPYFIEDSEKSCSAPVLANASVILA